MKNLLFLLALLFVGTKVRTLGAQTAPDPKTLSSYPYESEFGFNQTTLQYRKLGFGDYDALFRFAKSTIGYATVFIDDQDGHIDSNSTPYKFDPQSENFVEFARRATALQLQHAINIAHFPKDRELKLSCSFKSGVFHTEGSHTQSHYTTQLFADNIPFVPNELSDGAFEVPVEILDSLDLQMDAGGRHVIPCPEIKDATLEVYDGSNLVYKGNSLKNFPSDPNLTVMENYSLYIGRKFLTNGYTGTLMIHNTKGRGIYRLQDGILLPVMFITQKEGQIIVTVQGSAFQSINLLSYADLTLPPTSSEGLSLDENGSLTWTNTADSPTGFFSISPPVLELPTQQSKR